MDAEQYSNLLFSMERESDVEEREAEMAAPLLPVYEIWLKVQPFSVEVVPDVEVMLRIDAPTFTFCDASEEVKVTLVNESVPACCEKRGQLMGLVMFSVNVSELMVSVIDATATTNTAEIEELDSILSTVLVTDPDSEKGWSVVLVINSVVADSGVV